MNPGDDVQSVAVAQAHIDDRIVWRIPVYAGLGLRHGFDSLRHKSPLLHRARQPVEERLVVIDDQERLASNICDGVVGCHLRYRHSVDI